MPEKTANRIPLDDLLVFHGLSRSLASSVDLESILRTILEHMEHLIEAELWTLLMLDAERKELYYAIAAGGEEKKLRDLRVKVGEGVAGWVAQHGETLILPDTQDDPRVGQQDGKKGNVRSVIALPLRGRKGTHGVIEILNPRASNLNDYTIAFLHILADHAAIAIENANDMARIQQLTITDDATGLFNVRHLYSILAHELDESSRKRQPLSLLFLDLDRFKSVNDLHGHLIGSELLARTGKRLQELSRPQDMCFRYGGDEFVIVLPNAAAAEAKAHAEGLLRSLMETRFSLRSGLELTVSASIGVATAPKDASTLHAIIGIADSRMYSVKTHGRGSVQGA